MNSNSHFRGVDMGILVGLKSLLIFRLIIYGDFLKSGFSLFPLIVLDCRAHLVSVRRDSVARKVVTTWLFLPLCGQPSSHTLNGSYLFAPLLFLLVLLYPFFLFAPLLFPSLS